MPQDTCALDECGKRVNHPSSRGQKSLYCSTKCRKRKEVLARNAEYKARDAQLRAARRKREKLDPEKVAQERARQRAKSRRLASASLAGWRKVANELPGQIDTEMDALELWRYIECGWCGEHFWTRRADAVMCSRRCKSRARESQRRALKRGSNGSHTRAEVLNLWRSIGGQCGYCRTVIGERDVQADHFVSLSYGGANDISNIVPACGECNADKRELSLAEWNDDRARRGLPSRTLHPKIEHLATLALAA